MLVRHLILCLLAALALGAAQPAEPPAWVALRPVANLYSAPREDVDVVSQVLLGARLLQVERREGWVRVQGDDAYQGWIQAEALRALDPGERYPASLEPGRVLEVTALAANVTAVPDLTKRAPLLTVPFGVRLERVASSQDGPRWLQVRLPDRRLAWVQSGDVRTDLRPLTLEESLQLARRFLGINYTWGGTSSFGFDCSGFTQTLLRSRGILMPRDARVQAEWPGLAPVPDRAQLQPGDLLFFAEHDRKRITHTGLYLGDGSFIHDTTWERPCVQLTRLDEPYWAKRLVALRRPK